MFRPFRATLMLLVLLAAGPLPDALAQSSPHNPSVVPITAHYAGLTYGEWSARWWQWFFFSQLFFRPSME